MQSAPAVIAHQRRKLIEPREVMREKAGAFCLSPNTTQWSVCKTFRPENSGSGRKGSTENNSRIQALSPGLFEIVASFRTGWAQVG